MKKLLSTIVASLVAIAFAGFAFAAEPAMAPGQPEAAVKTSPATPAKTETYKTVKKTVAKKHHKKLTRKHKTCKPAAKKSEAPASAPVTK